MKSEINPLQDNIAGYEHLLEEAEYGKMAAGSGAYKDDYFANAEKAAQLDSLKQDIEERKKYASSLFWLLAAWLIFVAACILLAGFKGVFCVPFHLSDTVLVTLLSGATINLIGLFAIVAWYLFPKKLP